MRLNQRLWIDNKVPFQSTEEPGLSKVTSKLSQLSKENILNIDAMSAAFATGDVILTVTYNRFWNALLQFVLILQGIYLV